MLGSLGSRLWLVGAACGALLGAAFVWALDNQSYNIWGAIIVVPLIILVDVVLLQSAIKREADPWISRILIAGLVAKIMGTFGRYYVAYVVYGGSADAEVYNQYAAFKYLEWRSGSLDLEGIGLQGTEWLRLVTTAIYTVIGPSPLAAFFVFSSAAFWGAYLLLRAFRTALPKGKARQYAAFVFLLPSMVYWPSSIGKEAWLMLFVGVTALGVAKFFGHKPGGILLLAIGAVGTAIVRPHISLMLFGAIVIAQIFRPTTAKSTGVFAKIVGVLVLGAAAAVLVTQSSEFLGLDDLSFQSVSDELQQRGANATQGGSAFEATPLLSPLAFPLALVTVLFRPLPFEATNLQLFVQSLEGLALLVLFIRQRGMLRRLPTLLRANPYLIFAASYVLIFVWGFSSIGNFGILARQRVLMIPLLIVFLVLPTVQDVAPVIARRRARESRR